MGRRMGSRRKNFLALLDRPVLAHTLSAFEQCPVVTSIVVAVQPSDAEYCRHEVVARYGFKKVIGVVEGGAERQDSVANALKLAKGFDIVAVHDGARPLVTPGIIEAVIRAAVETGAAVCGVRPKDTIKETSSGRVKKTLQRESLLSVQTPQAFRTELLLKAFETAQKDSFIGTDESSLVERLGAEVSVVEGAYENIKITTEDDLAFAECVLRKRAAGL
ncbi:MAG: 2-C-methyl-D-erythritol 4-phosphate cytidylyltransferase [Deltaproteobacteria bacterium]|nr:2-C-methyl-D-erythritol 4-phosphate cytidylyltransferase [Deltaproteobacteria bacterium]